VGEALAKLEALGELLADLLGAGGCPSLLSSSLFSSGEIDEGEELADGVGAHAGGEGFTVLVQGFAILDFSEEAGTWSGGVWPGSMTR